MKTDAEKLAVAHTRMAKLEARVSNLEGDIAETLAAAEAGDDLRPHLRRLKSSVDRRGWTAESVIESIDEWVREYERVPASADWSPGKAMRERKGDFLAETLDRFYEREWPSPRTVTRYFGSFNAAITEAGHEPNPPGLNERSGQEVGRDAIGDRLPTWDQWHLLATYRERRGITQLQLVERAGVSLVHYAQLERGNHTNPGIRTLLGIAKGLEVPPAALVT